MKYLLIALCVLLFFNTIRAQKPVQLLSPDKKLRCKIQTDKEGIKYQVSYNNTPVISSSRLLLQFKDGFDLVNTSLLKPVFRDSTEKYDLHTGRSSHVESQYKEVIIPLRDKKNSSRIINIIFRAFNDGIAFRYQVTSGSSGSFTITEEVNQFKLAGNPKTKALILPGFTSSHEGLYTTANFDELPSDTLIDMPVLFSFPSGIFLSITEAALLDYAGM